MNGSWDPWKVTAIAMALMMATALVTGLVVANRVGDDTRAAVSTGTASAPRSEERRVGKEGRARWAPERKNERTTTAMAPTRTELSDSLQLCSCFSSN